MDDTEDKAKDPGPSMGQADNRWQDTAHRELALIKAVEARSHGDDDHAIIARAGRFLNFLKTGS